MLLPAQVSEREVPVLFQEDRIAKGWASNTWRQPSLSTGIRTAERNAFRTVFQGYLKLCVELMCSLFSNWAWNAALVPGSTVHVTGSACHRLLLALGCVIMVFSFEEEI